MEALLVSEVRSFVRSALDEIQPNDSAFEGLTDDSDMNSIIDSKIIEAVRFVHENASPNKIGEDAITTLPTLTFVGSTIKIPSTNIMRLIKFQARDSEVPVTQVHGEDEEISLMQSDTFACGTYQKPVIIKRFSGDTSFLQYYSLRTPVAQGPTPEGSDIDIIAYIPYPAMTINADPTLSTIQICGKVKLAILNIITALTLLVYNDKHADDFINQAKLYM